MKWDIHDIQKWPWHKHPPGLINLDAGNSIQFNTGSWRSRRPVLDLDRCSQCLVCYIYCPETSIQVQERKVIGIDYDHCKGCGICAEECPRLAIALEDEAVQAG